MKVTSVQVTKAERQDSRLKGYASIVLDDMFAVHDLRIIEGNNGLFVAMPSKRTQEGGFVDLAHPINPKAREMITIAVLNEFNGLE